MLGPRNGIALSLVLGLFPFGFVCGSGNWSLELEELAPGVYMHQGRHVSLESSRRGDSANIGFIAGEQCVAVVDSGGAFQVGRWLAREIKERVGKPVCYLINTHVHFDHVLGNAAFSDPKVKLVAHPNFMGTLVENSDFFSDNFADEIDGGVLPHEIDATHVIVDQKIEIDLGNRKLTIEAHGSAHSHTDVTIFDRATNTLWAGDLLFRGRMPVLDGSLVGWIDWMERVMNKKYGVVVPGHGKPDRDWPKGAVAQFRYLKNLLDETRGAITAGVFIEDAKNVIGIDERTQWELHERAHARNVSRAFRQLEWE